MLAPSPEPPAALVAFQQDCNRFNLPRGGSVVLLTSGGEICLNPALADTPTPAGSLAKIVTAQVGAQARCASLSRARECRGALRWTGANGQARRLRCWNARGHGSLMLGEALAQSCNLFFFSLGRELSPDQFRARATAAGFTAAEPGIWQSPLSPCGDVTGLHLTPRTAAHWMLGLAQNQASDCAVGQQQLRAGMVGAVRAGTAKGAHVPGLYVAGKTGTALYADGSNRTWGWFVGWARPAEAAQNSLGVAVRVPAATGPRHAAPLAGQFLRAWQARGCP